MKAYICDQCRQTKEGIVPVEVVGVGRKSGILLPHCQQQHDFCSEECFWVFVRENMPTRWVEDFKQIAGTR